MVKKSSKSGNNGLSDKDLWQFVTRSVRPYGKKSAVSRSTAKETLKEKPPVPRKPLPLKPREAAVLPPPKAFDKGEEQALRKGKRKVEAKLDLHGMNQSEAYNALHRSITAARRSGKRTLLVITGKGRVGEGVLRRLLPLWLEERDLKEAVLAFSPARAEDGGAGAFYLRLRKD